jgi:hypothetical protein
VQSSAIRELFMDGFVLKADYEKALRACAYQAYRSDAQSEQRDRGAAILHK